MNTPTIQYRSSPQTVLNLIGHYEGARLNLEPGFQRRSVWKLRDRQKLIESMLRGYPLPAIFLYRRHEDGEVIYDVIDGKQRLESIFGFLGLMRGRRFALKVALEDGGPPTEVDWNCLKRRKHQRLIHGYELAVIEVDGDMGDIIDLFVRINSTGKALTSQEKRHARYYHSPLLKEANRVARKFESFFLQSGILSPGQISRMKHVEFVLEIMLSLDSNDVLNKKTALDRVMAANSKDSRSIKRGSALATNAINRVRKMFPDLGTSRFGQLTDFYSLTLLVGRFEAERKILTDRKRNRLAWDLLNEFGARVDEVRELQRKAKGAGPEMDIYRDYLLTVSQMTDDIQQRRKRETILRGLLASLFEQKDAQRGFTVEQRRILWAGTKTRQCQSCRRALTWSDFTIDHIDPHSKGGHSRLDNAALLCRNCNSSKGNRSMPSRSGAR